MTPKEQSVLLILTKRAGCVNLSWLLAGVLSFCVGGHPDVVKSAQISVWHLGKRTYAITIWNCTVLVLGTCAIGKNKNTQYVMCSTTMILFLSIELTFQRLLCTCNIDVHDEFISTARILSSK